MSTEFDFGISNPSSEFGSDSCWCCPSGSCAECGMTFARTLKLAPDKMSLDASKMSVAIAKSPGQLLWPTDLLPLRAAATAGVVKWGCWTSSFQVPSLLSCCFKLPGVLTAGDSRDWEVKLSLNGLLQLPTPESKQKVDYSAIILIVNLACILGFCLNNFVTIQFCFLEYFLGVSDLPIVFLILSCWQIMNSRNYWLRVLCLNLYLEHSSFL